MSPGDGKPITHEAEARAAAWQEAKIAERRFLVRVTTPQTGDQEIYAIVEPALLYEGIGSLRIMLQETGFLGDLAEINRAVLGNSSNYDDAYKRMGLNFDQWVGQFNCGSDSYSGRGEKDSHLRISNVHIQFQDQSNLVKNNNNITSAEKLVVALTRDLGWKIEPLKKTTVTNLRLKAADKN